MLTGLDRFVLFPWICGYERILGGKAGGQTTRHCVRKEKRRRGCMRSQENQVMGDSYLEIEDMCIDGFVPIKAQPANIARFTNLSI
jgi:hypothetical protein